MEITTDVNSRLPKATMIFDEDRRRCSKEAGDPQGGCKYNHLNCPRQYSMFSAKIARNMLQCNLK